jgi:hypothetical protein
MSSLRARSAVLCSVVVIWGAAPGAAIAAPIYTVSFSQTGFTGGATVTGSFTGTDADGDGWLNSFVSGEITGYSMSFSGNVHVGAFSHTITDFAFAGLVGGLVYRLPATFVGDFLGDDGVSPFEGIASGPISGSLLPPPATLYGYRTGPGPTGMFPPPPFGFVEDNTPLGLLNPLGNVDHTFSYVVITGVTTLPGPGTVPEPSTLALVGAGLLAARLRRSRKRPTHPSC